MSPEHNLQLLMTPGPVPMPFVVKKAFANFEMHHRSSEFTNLFKNSLELLQKVFQTENPCFILPATGTGGMEAALVNTLSPGDSVVVVNGGKFGARWSQLGKTFGLNIETIEIPWGEAVSLQQVKKAVTSETKAVLLQACETSTGVVHPVQEIGEWLKNHQTLFIVDGITAVAAFSVPMDLWGIDVLVAGSQKGFMMPTGLSFLSFSEKARGCFKSSTMQKSYFNMAKELKANTQGKTRYSSPVQFVKALVDVCEQVILDPSLDDYFSMVQGRARFFRNQVNLPLFAKVPSPSLSCLEVPDSVKATDIKNRLFKDYGIAIVAGQDEYKDRLLRIGHMGEMSHEDLDRTAKAINTILSEL